MTERRAVWRAYSEPGGQQTAGCALENEVGIGNGDDLPSTGQGVRDPGVWSPAEPPSSPSDPSRPAGASLPPPADLAGSPPPGAPGTLVVLWAGQTTTRLVGLGELLIVGRDPDSGIVLADPRVSSRHASIERRGPGWLVRGLDAANPTWLLDATGRAQPVKGELGLRSGELLMGGAQVRLYPPAS